MKEEQGEDSGEDEEADDLEVEGLIPVKRSQSAAKAEVEVTDEMVEELHDKPMENFNGNFDHRGEFKEWNEVVSKETTQGDLLYVLPYSIID